ncbi:MAG: T9SS type A sorting domain-containing protein [Ignavibacteria bacterium]|nr:T9SS type A sorting domain-containing protein [Ignavibacteria bacterium]
MKIIQIRLIPSLQFHSHCRRQANVKLKVFDITGKEIKVLINEYRQIGGYEVKFDGSDLASGIYYYKLEAGSFTEVKKMILIK